MLCHEQRQSGQPGGFPPLMLQAKLGIDRARPEPAHVPRSVNREVFRPSTRLVGKPRSLTCEAQLQA
eukprot:3846634-Alexandrium_andersonii.AAC.1